MINGLTRGTRSSTMPSRRQQKSPLYVNKGLFLKTLSMELDTLTPRIWRPHGDSNPGTHRERVMS